ncbi:MAG: 2-amino-4-hydroxy-6-hydroxymethyldihydropteridine diphosphokinase [candidate division WOR-3 bacterium]|nr:2-amino-4-hydroxy-6-hydroxymethyldihydropteridine diphosphokinase [candidate division WOR-3 bacterium]
MNKIYLSIGSNTGDRKRNLNESYLRISKLGEARGSHIYRAEPWGRDDLPEFLNACISLESKLCLKDLFHSIQIIEKEMGRIKKEKWGSRIIDIDILISQDLIFKSPQLEVPHPFLRERRFYLEPLCEIAEEERDPISGKKIKVLLEECSDRKKVWKTGNILQLKA